MNGNIEIRRCRGMTLIEVVIVIAIIATLAAVAVPSIISTLDLKDREATQLKLDNIETALNNYYEDVGEYPSRFDLTGSALQLVDEKGLSSIDYLVSNPYPAAGTDLRDTVRHEKWNGPYLTASFNKDDYKRDAWGRDIAYEPQYGRSRNEAADGQQYSGAEDLPANSVMVASMGKTPGWGFRDAGKQSSGGPTLGMVTWRELTKFIPYSELFGKDEYKHLLMDNVIKVISPANIDRVKAQETEERYEEIKAAICGSPDDLQDGGCIAGFAADIGLSKAPNLQEAKPEVALNLDDFRDFDNPLQLLIMRHLDPGAKDLYYGAPRDVPPPYRMGDPSEFNIKKSDLSYSWMGWRGPYLKIDYGTPYINDQDDIVTTYDCFLDGWIHPLKIYDEGDPYGGAVLDLGFGNRDEDEDNYSAFAGLIASPGPNRLFDRIASTALDPNLQRSGSDPGGMFGSEGQDDDDVFVPLYKRDLWANIAPDMIIEGLEEQSSINTPVDIQIEYNTGTLPSVRDYVSGIAIIYPDPKQAAGFNVVELMGSSAPIEIMSPTNEHIYKNSFSKVQNNQFIPVGYAFIYIKVVHHQNIGSEQTGFCPALQQKLGWEEVAWTGVTQTQVYGERVCVKNGISTISLKFTILGGG
ncbi:MAG: prepilin-type N-terminal cleavage/methylation domain-containing protein [Candidatus Coatesbacteria bacterium]|nr:prepilin-type N-terminal cleavage/methylation domain-containing protein [Candidatus Coatesbacteria bacterium]